MVVEMLPPDDYASNSGDSVKISKDFIRILLLLYTFAGMCATAYLITTLL